MDTWEVNPLTLATLLVTLLVLLGYVARGIRRLVRVVVSIGDRVERWDVTAEAHPGLQTALTQQTAATAQLTADMATLAANMGRIGTELHTHVQVHRQLERQVGDIHQATTT